MNTITHENSEKRLVVQNISEMIFRVLPMLRKRLQRLEGLSAEQQMPFSHVQVLSVLNDEGALTVSEISRRFNIAKPNITPLVDRLAADGLVERQRSPEDRRVVYIAIMEPGRERLQMVRESILRVIDGWSDRITENEMNELSAALDSMIRILSKV